MKISNHVLGYGMVTIHSAIFHENASVMGKDIEDLA